MSEFYKYHVVSQTGEGIEKENLYETVSNPRTDTPVFDAPIIAPAPEPEPETAPEPIDPGTTGGNTEGTQASETQETDESEQDKPETVIKPNRLLLLVLFVIAALIITNKLLK